MKTKNFKIAGVVLSLTMSLASFSGAMANDEQYLNSDPIDINGYVKPEIEATDQELETIKGDVRQAKTINHMNKKKTKGYKDLVKETEKLSETSEEMIAERQEAQKEVAKYKLKVDCMMGRASGSECDPYVKKDTVKTAQAAPAAATVVAQAAPVSSGDNFGELIKVLPYTGLTTFISDNERLEANIAAGIKVESNINNRFSVGIGFAYTSLKTNDFAGFGSYNLYNPGREIDYANMNFNLYSKFFIVKNKRFRPYVGAGLGYNRTTVKYTSGSTYNPYGGSSYGGYGLGYGGYGVNPNFGNEEVITSSINAELMVGSEVIFTDMIGMILEFNYMRGLGDNLSSQNRINALNAPDQQRLQDFSAELSSSNVMSLFAGMLIQF